LLTGSHHSKETKQKISEANGSENHPFYGKKHSEESRRKMSESRKNQVGEKSSNWKGGNIKIICRVCGKEKYFERSHINHGYGKFCSLRCHGIWKIKHVKKKNTDIEIIVEQELLKRHIPYLKQVPILGIALVDFLLSNGIVIQCDGDYWHSSLKQKEKDMNQDFILTLNDYKIFRFTGIEIKGSVGECINKIEQEGIV
jgi:very-short-patch-repair endonuclease